MSAAAASAATMVADVLRAPLFLAAPGAAATALPQAAAAIAPHAAAAVATPAVAWEGNQGLPAQALVPLAAAAAAANGATAAQAAIAAGAVTGVGWAGAIVALPLLGLAGWKRLGNVPVGAKGMISAAPARKSRASQPAMLLEKRASVKLAGAAGDMGLYPGPLSPSEVGSTGLPGDIGFDPLGLANFDLLVDSAIDKERSAAYVMRDYRDAEVKHGRLAMLAALAWPLQEKLNPILAAKFHVPNLVAETGYLSPSVLNGGLEQGPIPASIAAFFILASLIEAQGLRVKKEQGDAWLPGDYGDIFPLNHFGKRGSEKFFSAQAGEVWNGRIAMIAILAYVVQEAVTKYPTINTIPFV